MRYVKALFLGVILLLIGQLRAHADFINTVTLGSGTTSPGQVATVTGSYNSAQTRATTEGYNFGAIVNPNYNYVNLNVSMTSRTAPFYLNFATTSRAYQATNGSPASWVLSPVAGQASDYLVNIVIQNTALPTTFMDLQIVDGTAGGGVGGSNGTFTNPTGPGTETIYGGGKFIHFTSLAGQSSQTYNFTLHLANSLPPTFTTGSFQLKFSSNPEPGSLLLAGLACAGLIPPVLRRRKVNLVTASTTA